MKAELRWDRALFFVSRGDPNAWEWVVGLTYWVFSQRARTRFEQYRSLGYAFQIALAEPDEAVSVELKFDRSARMARPIAWGILVLLIWGLVYEWKSYTLPASAGWVQMVLHTCGLR